MRRVFAVFFFFSFDLSADLAPRGGRSWVHAHPLVILIPLYRLMTPVMYFFSLVGALACGWAVALACQYVAP